MGAVKQITQGMELYDFGSAPNPLNSGGDGDDWLDISHDDIGFDPQAQNWTTEYGQTVGGRSNVVKYTVCQDQCTTLFGIQALPKPIQVRPITRNREESIAGQTIMTRTQRGDYKRTSTYQACSPRQLTGKT